ncbi:hypothetical protein SDRG_14423 [Saprolegnia diclina VS20]|uniref:SWIM-type domain-containing protein n=1 Tax=Saprolegnia diclina (strain VS20) TaxID=1156394 RepID=T0Q010_SAPDV|nr:hypothetical protein SDRG_14423 [Saprolegnia diclina VS20]EQC27841.1 hypothetical protein SDRG_14423 [Saprolegnia diclina VS20]|eukprot:XP_008618771.1 hypothetical protein SDRG_14423 [Saprolegnia diclina VS20]
MKRFFRLPASPSKRKYEVERSKLETALLDIEAKKQALLAPTDALDELVEDATTLGETRPVGGGSPPRPTSPAKTKPVAFSKPSFSSDLPMSLAMSFSSVNSAMRLSPSKQFLDTTSPDAVWSLKEVFLAQDASSDVKIGTVELHTNANLKAARELIARFLPSAPKGFVFETGDGVLDASAESMMLLQDVFPSHIRLRELQPLTSKEAQQRRNLVKERQQAAFEQFVQRRTQEPKPQEAYKVEVIEAPVVAPKPAYVPEPVVVIAPPKPPKHVLLSTVQTLAGHECHIKFLYFPTLERVILRTKVVGCPLPVTLAIHEDEFRKLVGVPDTTLLLEYALDEVNSQSILSNLILLVPEDAHGLFQMRLKRYVHVAKPRKEPAPKHPDEDGEKPPVVIEPTPAAPPSAAPERVKRVRMAKSPRKEKPAPAPPVVPAVEPEKMAPVPDHVEPPRRKTSPPKPREKAVSPRRAPLEQKAPAPAVEHRAVTAAAPSQHHRPVHTAPEKASHDDHHRRLRANLEAASRSSISAIDDGDDDVVPEAAPALKAVFVHLAIQKLRAGPDRVSPLHHGDGHKDDIDRLYAASNPRSISLSRHCLIAAFWDYLSAQTIFIPAHPIQYALAISEDSGALSHVAPLLALAIEDEIAACDAGNVRDIQHDWRKAVMDDVVDIAHLIEKTAEWGEEEVGIIRTFETKLSLICHVSRWSLPSYLRAAIFEGVFPLLNIKELPLETPSLSYISAKEMPFKPQLLKNHAQLEPELHAMLELLYILAYSYYHSPRCTEKRLRHFATPATSPDGRVGAILLAIDERQARLKEARFAFTDVTSHVYLERIILLEPRLAHVHPIAKASKLPSFFKELAVYLIKMIRLYRAHLASAFRVHDGVQMAQSMRFLLELVKAHVHEATAVEAPSPIGDYLVSALQPRLGLDKVNIERTRLHLPRVMLQSEFCLATHAQCAALSTSDATRRRARWDSAVDIPSTTLQRYFFKGEHELLCEFVLLSTLPDLSIVSEPMNENEDDADGEPTPLDWEQLHAVYVDEVVRLWTYLLNWRQQKSPDGFRVHVAFGLNIRQATDAVLTPEMLANTNLSFFLHHPDVQSVAVAFAVSDQLLRVSIRFYQEVASSTRHATVTHRPSTTGRHENNAFNQALVQLGVMPAAAVSIFLLQKGLQFMTQNLFGERQHAWDRLPRGRPLYDALVESRLTTRYAEDLMEIALDKIFAAIGDNPSLLTPDIVQLLLRILERANNDCVDKDGSTAAVQSTVEFIAAGTLRLLQHLLAPPKPATPAVPSLSSVVALPPLTQKQKCFVDCDGLGLLHDMLSAPSFLSTTAFVDGKTTKTVCEALIRQVLLTREMCGPSRALIVHHTLWTTYILPRIESDELEVYTGVILQALGDVLLGAKDKHMVSYLIQCSCGCPRNRHWTSDVYEAMTSLFLDLIGTKVGVRWAQEHDMAGVLGLLRPLEMFYIQLLRDTSGLQARLLRTIYLLARRIKILDSLVKFFDVVPTALIGLYSRGKVPHLNVEILRVLASLLHLGLLRKVPHVAVGVYGATVTELSLLLVDAVTPHMMDIVPTLWSDMDLSKKVFRGAKLLALIADEHHASLALATKATDLDGRMPSLLMLFVNLLDAKLDKALVALQLPALMGLICLCYDPTIALICTKDNLLAKVLDLHETVSTPFISTKQQLCIWIAALLCTHISLHGAAASFVSDQTMRRVLKHSYASIARINRSRSNGFDVYVGLVNRQGAIDVFEPPPVAGKRPVHDMTRVLTSLRLQMVAIETDPGSARDDVSKQDHLLEWEENLEASIGDRDDRTSTLYFILMCALSCMTSSVGAIKESREVTVVAQSIAGYFIAEELTPPEYFVATYCFALKNIVFAAFRAASLNEIWEQQTLMQFLKKLFGFVHAKKPAANLISLGQQFALELFWGLVLISKGKEAWFLKEDLSDAPPQPLVIAPLKTSISVLTRALVDDGSKPVALSCAKLKVLGDAAASTDPIVAEYACAVLATLIEDANIARFFLTEIGYNKLLIMVQQQRDKASTRHLRLAEDGDDELGPDPTVDNSEETRQVGGANLLYDVKHKASREMRALLQLLRLIAVCIRVVAKTESIENDAITKFEKRTKDNFVSLLHELKDPPVLVQVLCGIRHLIPLAPTHNFDVYFERPEFDRLYHLCLDPTTSETVQIKALRCARFLLRKYAINTCLARMLFDGRMPVVLLFGHIHIKLQIEAVYLLFEISMIYINKKQRRALAQTFDAPETRPILAGLFTKFELLMQDEASKAHAQLLMDILIRLIIQLDLLNCVNDDFLVEAICHMIATISPDTKATTTDQPNLHTPLRPMLCAALAKLVCKGDSAPHFLQLSRIDTIVKILSQESTLGELMDLACILLTLASQEAAIAAYLGTSAPQAIKHICHVLGSFYELQMVNSGPAAQAAYDDEDDDVSSAEVLDEDENDATTPGTSQYRKFRTVKQRLLLKIFFPKTEELKVSRHLHQIYKYYLKLLTMILEVHGESSEVHGCRCATRDGCPLCAPSDLLRKANGAHICRWLLLAKRISVAHGASYMTAPERDADSIVFHTLRLLRSACFNHLFRCDFLEGSTRPLASQSLTALQKLRDICANVHHPKLLLSKATLLDPIVILGQLCAEDGLREYLGVTLEFSSFVFAIINDERQVKVPYMVRACVLVLCRLASTEVVLHHPTFRRTMHLTGTLLSRDDVVSDTMCLHNVLMFYRNTVAFGKQLSPYIHEHLSDRVLAALGQLLSLTLPATPGFDAETTMRMAAADALAHLLFSHHKGLRHAMSSDASTRHPSLAQRKNSSIAAMTTPSKEPVAAVFRRIGATWRAHLHNMNRDDLSSLAGIDEKLDIVYETLYGEHNELRLFTDLLAIHTKLPPMPTPCDAPSIPSVLTPRGPLPPRDVPVFFATEHPVPSDLREYAFHGHLDHVPGSASLWKVLRKLFRNCMRRGELSALSSVQIDLLLRLLMVCAPDGRSATSAASSAWLMDVELEYIRLVHDVVHSHPQLHNLAMFETVSATAHRFFAKAANSTNAFSCRMRGFVLLHAFVQDSLCIETLSKYLVAVLPPPPPEDAPLDVDPMEYELPTRARECLNGLVVARCPTTWTSNERAKPRTLTSFAPDVAQATMLPFGLGVISALVRIDSRFIDWFVYLGGFATLLETLDLELEFHDVPVVPSRVTILKLTLDLMRQSLECSRELPLRDAVTSNLRLFSRLLVLTAHTKMEIKQASMGVVMALVTTPQACNALYLLQAHNAVLPVVNNREASVVLSHLEILRPLFGQIVTEHEGQYFFIESSTTIDARKFSALATLRVLHLLKHTTLVKLSRGLESLSRADSKTLSVLSDGRCANVPLWLIERYVERESFTGLSLGADHDRQSFVVVDLVARLNALLVSHTSGGEKGYVLTRAEYLSAVDEKERTAVARAVWSTLQQLPSVERAAPKRLPIVQQICRALIENQAQLNRTVRRATQSLDDHALWRRQRTLHGLFGYLRKSLLLRSLSLEAIGALGRHMPVPTPFHEDQLETCMVVVNQGEVRIELRHSIFAFRCPNARAWKRTFLPGDIVWCPSWLTTDRRIEPYAKAKYIIKHCAPHTTVFLWTQKQHEYYLPASDRTLLSNDISSMVNVLSNGMPVDVPPRIAAFCREDADLRQLQVYGIQTLEHLAAGSATFAASFVTDTGLMNALVSLAFSTLNMSLVVAALEALRSMTAEPTLAQTFYSLRLDRFAPSSVLHGILDAVDLWCVTPAVATTVLALLRQIYALVPVARSTIPSTWRLTHFSSMRSFLVSTDLRLVEAVTALLHDLVVPDLMGVFTAGGLHFACAQLIGRCPASVLPDVLHLVLLFCQDTTTKAAIWAHAGFHATLDNTLLQMVARLGSATDEEARKFIAFFNMLTYSTIDASRDAKYRVFLGQKTNLVAHLVLQIGLGGGNIDIYLDCLWRLCHGNAANARRVVGDSSSVDVRHGLATLASTPSAPAFANSLRCIRSLSVHPGNADAFSSVGLPDVLFRYVDGESWQRPETSTALQALGSIFAQSTLGRSHFTPTHMALLASLYARHLEHPPATTELETWGLVLARILELLSCVTADARTRQIVWTHSQGATRSELGWGSWMQLLYPPQQPTAMQLSVEVKRSVHSHTLCLLAALCLEDSVAREVVAHPQWCRYFCALALDASAQARDMPAVLRLLIAIAEYCVGKNEPLSAVLPARPRLYRLLLLVGLDEVNALVFRVLWLWEAQARDSSDDAATLFIKEGLGLETYSACLVARAAATAADRCMFLGFLVHLVPIASIRGLLTVTMVADHVCACLRHLPDRMKWAALAATEDANYAFVAWNDANLNLGAMLHVIRLVRLVVEQDPLQGLLKHRPVFDLLGDVVAWIVDAVISLPSEMVAVATHLLVEWSEVLQYAFKCRVLSFERPTLLAFVQHMLRLLPLLPPETAIAGLRCLHVLCDKNIEVCLALQRLGRGFFFDLMALLGLATLGAQGKRLLFQLVQALVATSFWLAQHAVAVGWPKRCLEHIEAEMCAPSACFAIVRLLRVLGIDVVLPGDLRVRLLLALIAPAMVTSMFYHDARVSWLTCLDQLLTSAPALCDVLVAHWDACGGPLVRHLLHRLHDELSDVEVPRHESVPYAAMRVLQHLMQPALVPCLLTLAEAWSSFFKSHVFPAHDGNINLYAFVVIKSLVAAAGSHLVGTPVYLSLRDALETLDAIPTSIYLELVAMYVRDILAHVTSPSDAAQVPWSLVLERCVAALLEPHGWSRHAALLALHAFLHMPSYAPSLRAIATAIVLEIRTAMQSLVDAVDVPALEHSHSVASPVLTVLIPMGLDGGDAVYAAEHMDDAHVLPLSNKAVLAATHQGAEVLVVQLLRHSNAALLRLLLHHTSVRRTTTAPPRPHLVDRKRGTVAVPRKSFRRCAVNPPSKLGHTFTPLGLDGRRQFALAIECLERLDAATLGVSSLTRLDRTAMVVTHAFFYTDDAQTSVEWLQQLFAATATAGSTLAAQLVQTSKPLLLLLFRLAGSCESLALRKLATAMLWLVVLDDGGSALFQATMMASRSDLLYHLEVSLGLEPPQRHASYPPSLGWLDLLQTTCGLLAALGRAPESLSVVVAHGFIGLILRVLRTERPAALHKSNVHFMTLLDAVFRQDLETHASLAALMLHVLQCLELDNEVELRAKAVQVLHLMCRDDTGKQALEMHLFPPPSVDDSAKHAKATVHSLEAMAHLVVLTEALKLRDSREAECAAISLVLMLCCDVRHREYLRGCRAASPESLVQLIMSLLEVTIGTRHRNHVVQRTEPFPLVVAATGAAALACLERLEVHNDVFRNITVGSRLVVQLFAAMGCLELEIAYTASSLLVAIVGFATDPSVEMLLLETPATEDSDDDDEEEDRTTSKRRLLLRKASYIQMDAHLPIDHPKRHALNRLKCFRHKVGGAIPSYFELLARCAESFAEAMPHARAPLVGNVFELLHTALRVFYATIYIPLTDATRAHHSRLANVSYRVAFAVVPANNDVYERLQNEALATLYHLSCHVGDYSAAVFETTLAVETLLQRIRVASSRCQYECAQLLRAITRHESVKSVFYTNDLFAFLSWMNEPVFVDILQALLQTARNLLSPSNALCYNPLHLARLLLTETNVTSSSRSAILVDHATIFRRVTFRLRLESRISRVLKVTYVLQMPPDAPTMVIHRRYHLPNSDAVIEESFFCSVQVSAIACTASVEHRKDLAVAFTYAVAPLDAGNVFTASRSQPVFDSTTTLVLDIADEMVCDLANLSGPLGDVLSFCVHNAMVVEVDLISELLGELCKHDAVFCDPSLHLWCFVAFLTHYGGAHSTPTHAMACLKAIGEAASPDHATYHTYLQHAMYLLQMLRIYGLSSDLIPDRDRPSVCLRHKEATSFLLSLGDMVAAGLSQSTAETYMNMLLLELGGVVRYLCGFHRKQDHLCCTHLQLHATLSKVWPAHARILAKKRFVSDHLRYFETNAHLSDASIEHAAAAILTLVEHSSSCYKFVRHRGLDLVGRLAHVLYTRYYGTTHPQKIATILRFFVLIASFLRTNLLVAESLPPEIHHAFFPNALSPHVMPFLELVLWPLLPFDDQDVWLESTMLAATLLAQVVEASVDRRVIEQHVLAIGFRVQNTPRVLILQRAVQRALRLTARDHAFAVRVVQHVYFLAVVKGIKTGILSAECRELLPTHAITQLETLSDDSFDVVLRYCVQFTEQHRDSRLREILVRNRKKGIGDMLHAVDHAARLVTFVHHVLRMVLEMYIGIVANGTPHADAKLRRVTAFVNQLETLALTVLSVLDQLDASYFGHIFVQFREVRFPEARLDINVVERRHFMRNNMKKILFILKRIIDRKKLGSLLDEASFTHAEAVLRDIRLEFAVNGRRRLGQACAADASIADLFCEAIEAHGVGPFATLMVSARYLFARTMRKDDNSSYCLDEFMVGHFKAAGLGDAIRALLRTLGRGVSFVLKHPCLTLSAIRSAFVSWRHRKAKVTAPEVANVARRRSMSLANHLFHGVDRPLVSFFPLASLLTLPMHEAVASTSLLWKHLRVFGTDRLPDGTLAPKPRFVERLCPTLPSAKQELLRNFLKTGDAATLETHFEHAELYLLRQKLESLIGRDTGADVSLDIVQHATLPVNVWQFILSPVQHTRLLHLEFVLSQARTCGSLADAVSHAKSLDSRHLASDLRKLSGLITLPLRPRPVIKKPQRSKRHRLLRRSSRRAIKQWVARSVGMSGYVEKEDRKTVDEIKKDPTDIVYAEFVLPVADKVLEDPLSEQMAWGYLVDEIKRNLFPRWTFEVDDEKAPRLRRVYARSLRWLLRAFLNLTFWRLEELKLDLLDDSWPETDILRSKHTTRTKLTADIVHSIVIYKHAMKAVSELCTVWMKESGSLGLRFWQHWSFWAIGWIVPLLLFCVVLPQLDAAADSVDYFMKWFMGGFFVVIYLLVVLSILQLIKQSENMMVQERQSVRFYPVLGYHGNYLAVYGLFMELVQQNTIPFSKTVKWVSGFRMPKIIAAIGSFGITGVNLDALKLAPLDVLYLKAYVAITVVFAYLVLLKCANKFHKSYPKLNKRLTKDLPPFVSSILFVAIINTFLSFLFCCTCDQFQDAASQCTHTQPFLYAYPDVNLVCWSPDHLPLAFIGLVGLTFFLPIGVLSAGMAEVLFPREDVDIKFSPIIVLASQLGKTIAIVAALFFTFYREYMVTIGMVMNIGLFGLTLVCKTSSIWYVSIVKSFIYVISVWTSICAFANLTLANPTSNPVYYLNLGWFTIFVVALVVLFLEMRIRSIREAAARAERLRDYQLLNANNDDVRLTDFEEDFMRRSRKPTTAAQLEALAPPGFLAGARAKTKAIESQELPPHLDDFLEKARRSAERPSISETMFLRRARRLGHRIELFEKGEGYRHKQA